MTDPEKWIAMAARRATAKWKAASELRRKLESHGADTLTVQHYADKLAEAMR